MEAGYNARPPSQSDKVIDKREICKQMQKQENSTTVILGQISRKLDRPMLFLGHYDIELKCYVIRHKDGVINRIKLH